MFGDSSCAGVRLNAMAIWRCHDLEQLLGGPLDASGLTEAALRRLVEQQVLENEQLDYKLKVPWTPDRTAREDTLDAFAKDVASFANGRGGLLLYGIEQTSGDALPQNIIGLPSVNLDQVQGALVARLVNHVSPVPDIAFVQILREGGDPCLAVVVPPSEWAPHGVSKIKRGEECRPQVHPVRMGAHTRWMTEPEIATRYLERSRSEASRVDRADRLVHQGKERLQVSDSVWMYLAVTPERPVSQSLTSVFVRDASEWLSAAAVRSPLRSSPLMLNRTVVAPGRVICTTFPAPGLRVWMDDVYVELHTDGAAFVAVDGLRRAEPGRRSQRQLYMLELIDALLLASQIAPRWARDQSGDIGMATLRAGIACQMHNSDAQFDLHYSTSDDESARIPSALGYMLHDPKMQTLIDLSALSNLREESRIARTVACGILQWFGLVETTEIMTDGRLDPTHWTGGPGSGNEQQAHQWNQTRSR